MAVAGGGGGRWRWRWRCCTDHGDPATLLVFGCSVIAGLEPVAVAATEAKSQSMGMSLPQKGA